MVNVPSIEWREWTVDTDPSGIRISDDTITLNASGFQGVRSTSAGETLEYDPANIVVSGQVTETHVLAAHVESWGDASGIFNMKCFVSNIEHFGVGTYRFLYAIHQHWHDSLALYTDSDDMPTSEPTDPNMFSTIGSGSLSNTGWYDESQVTQYLYIALYVGTDVPVGTYGGAGTAGLRYRLMYDFS